MLANKCWQLGAGGGGLWAGGGGGEKGEGILGIVLSRNDHNNVTSDSSTGYAPAVW